MSSIRTFKICPTFSSLHSSNENTFLCPVNDCEMTLKNLHDLNSHLKKTHASNDVNVSLLCFHCPVNTCLYNKLSERHFKCFKYLKQHYIKNHAEKTLSCTQCDATFSQQGLLNSHLKQCGKTFKCSCGTEYTSREALLTHAKRKQHVIADDFFLRKKKIHSNGKLIPEENAIKPIIVVLNEMKETSDKIVKPRLLLPKPAPLNSIPLPTLAALALSELSVFRESTLKSDMSTQTDKTNDACCFQHICSRRNLKRPVLHGIGKGALNGAKRISSDNKRIRCNIETQTKSTVCNKRQKSCAQTQTLDNRILEKAMAEANLLVTCSSSSAKENLDCFPRQSIHTQTMFEDGQPFWSDISALIRNTSSTQTHSNERQCNSSQTEKDVFLGHMEASYNSSFSSSPLIEGRNDDKNHQNVPYPALNADLTSREHLVQTCETQTELDLDSFLMCDENSDSDNILYSNIHTQTNDDNLESIPYDQLLMTHMHTQTNELLFPELSFSNIQTQTSWTDFVFTENIQSSAQTQTRDLQLETEFTNSHTQTSKIII
uniref:C2H2-type domain-containing protein n=1 Tax=Strigamia maritima TaxID=126957 RepID=T1J2A3_STRMM